MKTTDQTYVELESQVKQLLAELIPTIDDDYRATDDPDDNTPGIQVTIGFTPATEDDDWSWDYQTGDNSFTGGAYDHPFWGVIYLYRDSDCAALAKDAVAQIAELVEQ